MFRSLYSRCVAIAALFVALPATATAAPVSAVPPAKSKATLVRPLSLVKTADLDFGTIIVTSAGTVVIDPTSGLASKTGGLLLFGTTSAASFVGASTGLQLIYVATPGPITITRSGGTQTMTVNNFVVQGGNLRLSLASGAFSFNVGATLNVATGQADGLYTGTFNVDATYF